MDSLNIKANAKINLALAVKYKRPDGYHEIESIFQEVDFYDEITLRKHDQIRLISRSDSTPKDDNNLCIRAAKLVQDFFKIPGVEIELKKNIPVGAGLGGGSSDAAAVMLGVRHLYGLKMSIPDLREKSAKLGSDIPFFFMGGSAYVTGRGEVLNEIKMPLNYYILLVFPDQSISTIWAYKNLKLALTKNEHGDKLTGFKFQHLKTENFRSEFYNDFEKLVFATYPDLEKIKQSLYESGSDYASLSGSGSTVYGIFSMLEQVERAKSMLDKEYQCKITRPVRMG